jgi:hypothetical protein
VAHGRQVSGFWNVYEMGWLAQAGYQVRPGGPDRALSAKPTTSELLSFVLRRGP